MTLRVQNIKDLKWTGGAVLAIGLLSLDSSPASAATDFAYDGISISSVALMGLLLGFGFCVLVAITRISVGENRILRSALVVGTIGITWIAYNLAAEFPEVSANSVWVKMTPVQATALTENTLERVEGGR